MTTQQQTTRQTQTVQPITSDHLDLDDPGAVLDAQTTIDPKARGDAYVPVQETNLPELSMATLTEGVLLYDPRQPSAVMEVLEQYQDDFGKEKVRVKVHTSDHRNGRTHSFFAPHVLRDFTYIRAGDAEADTDVEFSVDALTSAWDGDTGDEGESAVQTTLAKQDTDTPQDEPVVLGGDSTSEETDDSTTQDTLF